MSDAARPRSELRRQLLRCGLTDAQADNLIDAYAAEQTAALRAGIAKHWCPSCRRVVGDSYEIACGMCAGLRALTATQR